MQLSIKQCTEWSVMYKRNKSSVRVVNTGTHPEKHKFIKRFITLWWPSYLIKMLFFAIIDVLNEKGSSMESCFTFIQIQNTLLVNLCQFMSKKRVICHSFLYFFRQREPPYSAPLMGNTKTLMKMFLQDAPIPQAFCTCTEGT